MRIISKLVALAVSTLVLLPAYAQTDVQPSTPEQSAASTQASQTTLDNLLKTVSAERRKELIDAGIPEQKIQEDLATIRPIVESRFWDVRKMLTERYPNLTQDARDSDTYKVVLGEARIGKLYKPVATQ